MGYSSGEKLLLVKSRLVLGRNLGHQKLLPFIFSTPPFWGVVWVFVFLLRGSNPSDLKYWENWLTLLAKMHSVWRSIKPCPWHKYCTNDSSSPSWHLTRMMVWNSLDNMLLTLWISLSHKTSPIFSTYSLRSRQISVHASAVSSFCFTFNLIPVQLLFVWNYCGMKMVRKTCEMQSSKISFMLASSPMTYKMMSSWSSDIVISIA